MKIKRAEHHEKKSDVKFTFINPDHIRFFYRGKKKAIVDGRSLPEEDHVFELDYVRLVPTQASISKSRIELSKYQFEWNNESRVIEFNTISDNPKVLEIMKASNYKGRRIVVETLDNTLLMCHINDAKLEWILPVKEIDDSKAIVYGLPKEPYEIMMESL